jgi:hypothetical protein
MTAHSAEPLPEPKRPAFAVRAMRKLWRLAVDRPYRNLMWLYLFRPQGAFQPFNDTRADRYPRIFSFVQSEFGADSAIRILSFGCSTGEEVFIPAQLFSARHHQGHRYQCRQHCGLPAALEGDARPGNIVRSCKLD